MQEDFKGAPSSVTEAYKFYFKCKKQRARDENERGPDPDPSENPPPAPAEVWGSNLNKNSEDPTKSHQDDSALKPSGGFNYSKLTSKLMKGAKINIRSSLTRKKSVIFSPATTNDSPAKEPAGPTEPEAPQLHHPAPEGGNLHKFG